MIVGGSFLTNISVNLTEPTGRETAPKKQPLSPLIISVLPPPISDIITEPSPMDESTHAEPKVYSASSFSVIMLILNPSLFSTISTNVLLFEASLKTAVPTQNILSTLFSLIMFSYLCRVLNVRSIAEADSSPVPLKPSPSLVMVDISRISTRSVPPTIASSTALVPISMHAYFI